MTNLPFSRQAKLLIGFGGIGLGVLLVVFGVVHLNLAQGVLEKRTIYAEGLEAGWQDWSWGQAVSWDSEEALDGSKGIAWSPLKYHGMYVHTVEPIELEGDILEFAFKRETQIDNTVFQVLFFGPQYQELGKAMIAPHRKDHLQKDDWEIYQIPIEEFVSSNVITGIAWQYIPTDQKIASTTMYLDSISLVREVDDVLGAPPVEEVADVSTMLLYERGEVQEFWKDWSWSIQTMNDESGMLEIQPWGGFGLFTPDLSFREDEMRTITINFESEAPEVDLVVWQYDIEGKPLGTQEWFAKGEGKGSYTVTFDFTSEMRGFGLQNVAESPLRGTISKVEMKKSEVSTPVTNIPVQEVPSSNVPATDENAPGRSISPVTGYKVMAGEIYKDNQEVVLRGVNWFGFETGTYVVHGLHQRKWQDVAKQIKDLGFNSVRLPVCPASLHAQAINGVNYELNPDLQGKNSLEAMDMVMEELNKQQLYILVDHHTPDCQNITDLWYTDSYSEEAWVQDLEFIADRWKGLPYFMGIDIKNEPHGIATWGTGNVKTDWNTAAEKAGKAVLSANPNLLVFVQGVQQNPIFSEGESHWWGGNLEPVKFMGLKEESIPMSKLVFTPHVYGPDVYSQPYFTEGNFPANMPAIWERDFGYLKSMDYAMAPGEWGGFYGRRDPKDKLWQDALVDYFIKRGICSSYYWTFNPNSGDTGGILEDDWKTPVAEKVKLLERYYGECR